MKWTVEDYKDGNQIRPFINWKPPKLVYPCRETEAQVLQQLKDTFAPLPPYKRKSVRDTGMEREASKNGSLVRIDIPIPNGYFAFLENTAEQCTSPTTKHSQKGMQGARPWVQRVDTAEGIFKRLTDGYGISLMFGERCHQFIRNSNNWRGISGVLLDLDVFRDEKNPDAPEPVYSLDELLDRYPLLARICSFILPSASSLYEGRYFKARGAILFPEPITDQRVYHAVGDILLKEINCIPQNVTKNPLSVGFGNTHNATLAWKPNSEVDLGWILRAIEQAEQSVITSTKKRNREQKQKAELTKHYRKQRKADGNHQAGENISAFIEQCNPVAEMVSDGLLTPGSGNEYRWHESEHDRSCDIVDGSIHIFSHSMQKASPHQNTNEAVGAHRFYLYQLSGLDMTKESDRPKIREFLFERGYGSDPKEFARQQRKAGIQKPIRLEKRFDVSLVTEAITASWKFLSDAFEKGKGFIGLRSDTGTGKDHHAILYYVNTAANGFMSVPTTDHAKETAFRMADAGVIEFRWRGLHSERDGEFPHEAPCIMPDEYMAYLNSGRNAVELLCGRCPVVDECIEHGYRSQENKARQAQVIVAAHRDILFNPQFRHLAKRLLPKRTGDLIVINEFDCFDSFIDIQIPQARLEYLAKTWHDHDLGAFAELILKACIFEDNPIGKIRAIVDSLTAAEQHRIYTALTQYRIGDTILSRDEAHALEKRNPQQRLSDILALPLIETDNWNLLIELELFFDKYRDDEAPMRWHKNTLHFAIPPLPLYTRSKVVCMSATLIKNLFLKTFEARQAKRGDVTFLDGNDTGWNPESRCYQLRTNKNPRTTLLVSEQNEKGDWVYTGLTATGKGYMDTILDSLSKTDGTKAFISHKFIVETYRDELDALDVKVGWFGGLAGLDAHFGRDKDDGITLQILGSPEIPQHEKEHRSKLLGLTEEQVYDATVKSELMQAFGRAGMVKNPSTVILWTSLELPSVSHREQTRLMDDTDLPKADGYLSNLDGIITEREALEAAEAEATKKGDVTALMETAGVSERTARERTKAPRKQNKAERDYEICRRFADGQSKKRIATEMGISQDTVKRVLDKQRF